MPAEPGIRRSLMRATAGPHALLLDLRDLSLVGYEVAADGPTVVDLRRLLGVSETPEPGQRVLLRDRSGRLTALELDPGLELCSLDLRRLHPFPAMLRRIPGLLCFKGVAELEEGTLAFLVDPGLISTAAVDAPAPPRHSG